MERFDDPTQVIHVGVGQSFALALAGNPTTGYTWQAAVDQAYLQPLDREFEPQAKGAGAGGREVLTFHALQPGETTIRCEYKRPWQDQARQTERFSVRIAPAKG
jgi:inhibitor of cysteine peptidase